MQCRPLLVFGIPEVEIVTALVDVASGPVMTTSILSAPPKPVVIVPHGPGAGRADGEWRVEVPMSGAINGRLHGKVALVTGASRGIGAAIAQQLAADGAQVIVNYVANSDAAAEVVNRIREAGGDAHAVQADVSDVAAMAPLIAATIRHFGRLDVLVNNAAVSAGVAFDKITEAMFDSMVATNMKSVLFLSQAASRVFGDSGGVIINVSSIGTRLAAPTTVVYTATKAAVEMLTISMSRALGPRGIRVNAVAPGMTDTEMLRSVLSADLLDAALPRIALGPIGRTGDIAPVVTFLAFDDARWITGETIHVNGGHR